MAPAPALTKISTMARKWSTPKITDSATAPAAAASTKSHVGAGGAMRDHPDRLHCGIRRQPSGFDSLYRPHRRSYAIHIHAGRIGRYLTERCGLAVGLKL